MANMVKHTVIAGMDTDNELEVWNKHFFPLISRLMDVDPNLQLI